MDDLNDLIIAKALQWNKVAEQLDLTYPKWCDEEEGRQRNGDYAAYAVRCLASAAEYEKMSTLKQHIKVEMSVVRAMIIVAEGPLKVSLQGHLARMNRLVG